MSEKVVKVKREDLMEKDFADIQAELEGIAVGFAEEVEAIGSLEELKSMEQDLMDDFKEDEARLAKTEYDLPNSITTDGRTIKRNELIQFIIQFLNRLEVEFRATLGVYQGIRFWKNVGTNPIPYPIFDNTMRLLGTLKFSGESDCFNVLAINDWFTTAHDAYKKDAIWTRFLSTLHQVLMKRMETIEKEGDVLDPADQAEREAMGA